MPLPLKPLLIVLGSLFLGSLVLGWFDNTTELRPIHDNVLLACFVVAGLAGLGSGFLGIFKSQGMTSWRRPGFAFGLSLFGFLSVFLASSHTASIVEGLIDFPPNRTRSYETLLVVSRAYQTHGKGRSWNVQTTPIWSNLDVTEDDYNFMLTHRRVGDNSRNPDEITSNGYFCVHVTMQQAGNALRILHAGDHKLPKGSVVICPSDGGLIR